MPLLTLASLMNELINFDNFEAITIHHKNNNPFALQVQEMRLIWRLRLFPIDFTSLSLMSWQKGVWLLHECVRGGALLFYERYGAGGPVGRSGIFGPSGSHGGQGGPSAFSLWVVKELYS